MASNSADGERRPQRVRVTAPSTRSGPDLGALLQAEAQRERTLDRQQTRLLVRSRMSLALGCFLVFLVLLCLGTTGSSLLDASAFGIPARWLAIPVVAFAAMLTCAWWFLRATEAADDERAVPATGRDRR